MKQIIPFVKDLNFDTKISEITSIALEHNLQFENNDSIVGNFIVSGKYKINDISVSEESFEKQIPFDITLDDKYDASKVEIDIDDFYYEIINDEFLRVHIDVLADNLVYFEKEEKETRDERDDVIDITYEKEELKTDDETTTDEKDEDTEDSNQTKIEKTSMENDDKVIIARDNRKEQNEVVNDDNRVIINNQNNLVNEEEKQPINNFETSFLNQQEKYSTYKVHIIRENENVETIKKMYNVSSEELEKYNSLDKIVMGSKLVIPLVDEQQ